MVVNAKPTRLPIVLCVDDDPHVLKALQRLLRDHKCRVLLATNGREALELLEREAIDVMICDAAMPGLSGVEVLCEAAIIAPATVRILLTAHCHRPEIVIPAINEGAVFRLFSKPWNDDKLRSAVAEALELSSTEQRRRESEARTRVILENIATGIVLFDDRGIVESYNAAAEDIFGYTAEQVIGKSMNMLMPSPDREDHDTCIRQYIGTGSENLSGIRREVVGLRKGGSTFPMALHVSEAWVDERRLFIGVVCDLTDIEPAKAESEGQEEALAQTNAFLVDEIGQRMEAEAKLEQLHGQLVESSHAAGMAVVATSVLHNVGNVLNSVNVSATIIADKLGAFKIPSVAKTARLLRDHADDLAAFLTEDERGRQLPDYLTGLAEHLQADQNDIRKEIESLTKNIDHIKQIVSTQQSYAKASGVVERVNIAELLDDALHMSAASLERHGIEVVRQYADIPPLMLDKHKLLQILVNLVRNAEHALITRASEDLRLTMRIETVGDERLRIQAIDNGVGIERENLTRIFAAGFTTKKADGHGYGLHSSALAAKEMGGTLTAHSEGPNEGATFTFELPLDSMKHEVAA